MHKWVPHDDRLLLLVVDFGKLYLEEFAVYIPDPWLLCFKSASNWSAHAYMGESNERLKLLPACSLDDESSTSLNEIEYELRRFQPPQTTMDNENNATGIKGLSLEFTVGKHDDESVSSIGAEDVAALKSLSVVSDDTS